MKSIVREPLSELVLAIALGSCAEWLLRLPASKTLLWPWLILLGAMFLGAHAFVRLPRVRPQRTARTQPNLSPARRRLAMGLIGFACLLTAIVVLKLWPDYQNWHGTPAIWLIALASFFVGAWQLGQIGTPARQPAAGAGAVPMSLWLEASLFFVIMALAVFLRTFRLRFDSAGSLRERGRWRPGRPPHSAR